MPREPQDPRPPETIRGRDVPDHEDPADLLRDGRRELRGGDPYDASRPERLDPDDVLAFEEQASLRRSTVPEADRAMRQGLDLGHGEPLRAAEAELPRGPVEQGDYQERPYWALAILLIGVACLIATIIGNMVMFPVFTLAPEPMQHGWPWVVSTLAGILGGLAMGLSVWPKDHYGQVWWPATVATLTGLLVAAGVFLGLWMLFAFFL